MKILRPKIGICTDIHIGIHQNSELWHNIILKWANWFKEEMIRHDIKDIIIPGDIFNDRNEIAVNTIHITTQVFNILKDFNIIIIIGNHDAYYKDRCDVHSMGLLSGWDNVTIVDDIKTITAFDRIITFIPWGQDIVKCPKSDIIFGHFNISGFKMMANKICTNGIESKDLLEKAKLVLSGHFHSRDERKYKNGTIIYVGAPYQQNWGDVEMDRGYYTLDLQTLEYNFYKNNCSPRHIKIKLSDLVDTKGYFKTIKDHLKGNIVKVIVDKKARPDILEMLVEQLLSYKPLNITTEYNINNEIVFEEEYSYDGVDMGSAVTEFVNALDIDNKQDIIDYTLELYKAHCK